MKRFLPIGLAIGIVVTALFVAKGLIAARPEIQAKQQQPPPPPVATSIATPGPVTLSLHSQGTVLSKQKLQLTSDVNGRIIWLSDRFQKGEFIEANEALLKIDPTNYQLALAQAKLTLREAELSLADALTRFRQNAPNSPKHPQLKRAEAQVEAAEAQLKKAQQDLARTVINSPFPAIVAEKHVALGQFVTSSAALGELLGSSEVEIALPFAYRDLKLLEENPDLTIRLYTDADGQPASWVADSYRISKKLDNQTRVAYLIAEVQDPYARLSPQRAPLYIGQFVNAEIEGIVLNNAIELPLSALYEEQYVYKVDGQQRLRRTPVDIVRYTEDTVIIGSGLSAGDRIALTRLSIMANGMEVSTDDNPDLADSDKGLPQ